MYRTANIFSYGVLKENARQNRKNPTDAEMVFWSLVKGNALGCKFLRQHIIGDYIVDFVAFFPNAFENVVGLVVEIDGGYHTQEQQIERDSIRQQWLEQQGFQIIRFTNDEVLTAPEQVLMTLRSSLLGRI